MGVYVRRNTLAGEVAVDGTLVGKMSDQALHPMEEIMMSSPVMTTFTFIRQRMLNLTYLIFGSIQEVAPLRGKRIPIRLFSIDGVGTVLEIEPVVFHLSVLHFAAGFSDVPLKSRQNFALFFAANKIGDHGKP